MLTQTTEYALRAIVYLGIDHGEARTTIEISQVTRAPVGYLSKILQSLTRAHLVASHRGLHGGFVLARPPTAMTIYDVVQAIDPIVRIHDCPLAIEGHGEGLCLLHATLDRAMGEVETIFRSTRISDLILPRTGSSAHRNGNCPFPNSPPSGLPTDR